MSDSFVSKGIGNTSVQEQYPLADVDLAFTVNGKEHLPAETPH